MTMTPRKKKTYGTMGSNRKTETLRKFTLG